jgi:hypothetical protein
MQEAGGPGTGGPVGVPNFAWVDGRRLARGMQPPLTADGYRALQHCGISAVLSLRAAREYPDDPHRAYDVVDERALCAALGLGFHHVACSDYQAPRPGEVVRALSIIHEELDRGEVVFMHCFAGVGRTGVIGGGWQMLHGASSADAVREYAYFCDESWRRRAALRRPELSPAQYLENIGAHHQVWVLLRIARALGRTAELPPDFAVPPRRPKHGGAWQRRFHDQMQRHLGQSYPIGNGNTETGPLAAG